MACNFVLILIYAMLCHMYIGLPSVPRPIFPMQVGDALATFDQEVQSCKGAGTVDKLSYGFESVSEFGPECGKVDPYLASFSPRVRSPLSHNLVQPISHAMSSVQIYCSRCLYRPCDPHGQIVSMICPTMTESGALNVRVAYALLIRL